MKEFSAQTGGRYTYVDDINNLQELSLAFSQIFSECDNFIISGCKVSGNRISAGYIYLNGKIRQFGGAQDISKWPQYIYEANSTEEIEYVSGGNKVGRKIYGCQLSDTVPSIPDPITGMAPVSMSINEFGNSTIKEAFFGKYALLLNSDDQEVTGDVHFHDSITSEARITATSAMIYSGPSNFSINYIEKNLIAQIYAETGKSYKFVFDPSEGAQFFVDETLAVNINGDNISCKIPVIGIQGMFGSSKMQSNQLFNNTTASNDGEININFVGYNGGTQYFRNTNIGDGKGNAIIKITGASHNVLVNGVIESNGMEGASISLKSTNSKDNDTLQKYIVWKDASNVEIAHVGYVSTTSKAFEIDSDLESVMISAKTFVDLGPSIKENGRLLSEKYVLTSNYNTAMSKKAGVEQVYLRDDANNTFGSKNGGFTQFITTVNTADKLRKQIGAAGTSDLNLYAKKSNLLSDMATTTEYKKTIRQNIGAVGVDECQLKQKDTGWQRITEGHSSKLYVRQIGNIVCIEGIATARVGKGAMFVLPGTIDAPTHDIAVNFGDNVRAIIKANSKTCNAYTINESMTSYHGEHQFLMTYMV